MLQNCAIFYIHGDNIKSDTNIDLLDIEGSLGRCQLTQPLFYKQNNEYKLLIAQKMSAYTGQCSWQNNSKIYLNCLFDRKEWEKHSIKPSESDDTEIIGHVTDVETDILHVFYTDENGIIHDSSYNVSSEKFIKQAALQQTNLKKISYDSDRQLMYMFTNEMVYQKVKSNSGIFVYEPTYAKTLGDGRIAYYAGKEGTPEQVCIAEVLPDETLYMSLLVGVDSRSVYERIRSQLAPKPKPIEPNVETTEMPQTASRLSFQTTSFILIMVLLCSIFR
ncbi:unnamed protein product [Cercopithifilaria johnstoni]|uniref:Uncharacterized protein n=1 Tax=Cercopithifilaria johnstoni TaxID=2874296 RepID=A0A8J2LZ09_9BILA|nr:unnamed protein product [Cercopithifilaria johnstoni]